MEGKGIKQPIKEQGSEQDLTGEAIANLLERYTSNPGCGIEVAVEDISLKVFGRSVGDIKLLLAEALKVSPRLKDFLKGKNE